MIKKIFFCGEGEKMTSKGWVMAEGRLKLYCTSFLESVGAILQDKKKKKARNPKWNNLHVVYYITQPRKVIYT